MTPGTADAGAVARAHAGEGRLAAAAASFAAGTLDSVAFSAVFSAATVFAQRPAPPSPPGLVAAGGPGHGQVLAFSSLDQLAGHAGSCHWLSTTGADLLSLLPTGYGLLLDGSGPHPVLLPATALRRSAAASEP